MAKSLRSKTKRDYRSKKREQGVYAASEAARLHRLNSKLQTIVDAKKPEPERREGEDAEAEDLSSADQDQGADTPMDGDDAETKPPTKISTHGPRNSRREQWRASKGLEARPKSRGMNRQGGIAASRNAGRPKRRR